MPLFTYIIIFIIPVFVFAQESYRIDSIVKINQTDSMITDSGYVNSFNKTATVNLHDTVKVILDYPKTENNAFSVGEKLTFKVRYGFIRAGTATMEVMKDKMIRGKPVYHIQTRAESASGFSWIYKVEDVIDSYMDKMGLFSWKFEKRLREGSYMVDLSVNYFPEDSLADINYTRYEDETTIRDQEHYQVKTPPFSRWRFIRDNFIYV